MTWCQTPSVYTSEPCLNIVAGAKNQPAERHALAVYLLLATVYLLVDVIVCNVNRRSDVTPPSTFLW